MASASRPPKKHTRPKPEPLRIWQWNCRSYRHKKGALLQYIATHSNSPDVVALQEVRCDPTLPGYSPYSNFRTDDQAPLVTTLVDKRIAVIDHSPSSPQNTPHVLLEIIPNSSTQTSVYVLNIYSAPQARQDSFDHLFNNTLSLAKRTRSPVLIVGDFNAAHPSWGYMTENPKGRKLALTIARCHLTLLTDPGQPTRLGNSVTRDTCPDLTLTHGFSNHQWSNLGETLGSDHCILFTEIADFGAKVSTRSVAITDWVAFRKRRTLQSGDSSPDTAVTPITRDPVQSPLPSLPEWIKQIQSDLADTTRNVQTTAHSPDVDNHLIHIWDARRSLSKRWRRQRHNRKLRKRIALLSAEAERYAAELTRANWHNFCNQLQGTLGTAKTWSLLRSLLDSNQTKTETTKAIRTLLHKENLDENTLLATLKQRYISVGPRPQYRPYPDTSDANDLLDADITEAEVRAALQHLTKNTAAGADGIQYKLLRNLDDCAITQLTAYYNDAWRNGALPQEWKHADIVLIPKPGKPLSLSNLRPISLTSCLGKLLEHVILDRLQPHLEATHYFPDTMFGFRSHLATQDVLLQLKHDILDHPNRAQTRAVLTLDLKGAFDNVSHDLILDNLASSNCGERTYNYVRAFLADRTATIGLGEHRSSPFQLTGRGTPQGSVLSPTLFNVAMAKLPPLLDAIPDLNHSLYADDVTMWATRGSDGQIQDALQEATKVVQNYASLGGLSCAAEKSGLLVLPPRMRLVTQPEISVYLANTLIPCVPRLRILGLHLQYNGRATHTMHLLKTQITQITHMIRRISNRRAGLKETDTLRIVQSLVISRLAYHVPFHNLLRSDLQRLNIILRTAIKTALGLPPHASTQRLLQLGVHNTIEEIIEAQRVGQLIRLGTTRTGRHVLSRLGYPAPSSPLPPNPVALAPTIRARLQVAPLPKNMHAEINQGRRRARAEALARQYGHDPQVLYTDAASYSKSAAKVAVVCKLAGDAHTTCSVRTDSSRVAEETAIALAVSYIATARPADADTDDTWTIITDSQAACRAYSSGVLSTQANNILRHCDLSKLPLIRIVWTPGHASLPGNERAHALAREMTHRATEEVDRHIQGDSTTSASRIPCHEPLNYTLTLAYYRIQRKTLPPPHQSLSRADATSWRQLQTHTFPNLHHKHLFFPTQYPSTCPTCNSPTPTLYHSVWECPRPPDGLTPIRTPTLTSWEAALSSTSPQDQQRLIERARRIASAIGVLD